MGKNNDRIIAALLTSATVREAAEVAGVSERTIYTRLKDPEFKAELEKVRREMWRGYTTSLQGKVGKAIETIAEVMTDCKASPQVRLNAAAEIIRSSIKMTELSDIVERLAVLEEIAGGGQQ